VMLNVIMLTVVAPHLAYETHSFSLGGPSID